MVAHPGIAPNIPASIILAEIGGIAVTVHTREGNPETIEIRNQHASILRLNLPRNKSPEGGPVRAALPSIRYAE